MHKNKATNDSLIFELIKDETYRIHESGLIEKRIRAWDKAEKKVLWKKHGHKNDQGYVQLRYKGKLLKAHRIVFAKFKGYLRANLVINHIDGNKSNNEISNLELISDGNNQIHGYRVLGRKPSSAKLSWNQVDEIKAAWGSKEYTMTKLAEKYGVDISNISRAINGKQFKHRVDKNNG